MPQTSSTGTVGSSSRRTDSECRSQTLTYCSPCFRDFALSSPILASMHPCRCIVAFTDSDGIEHEVQVWASTVYDAIAQAMREFRQGSIARDLPGPHAEFSITVHRTPVTQRLKLQQVTRWAEGGGKSPRDLIECNRIRELLGICPTR